MGFAPWRSFAYALCLLSVMSVEIEVDMDEPSTTTPSAPPLPISETVTRACEDGTTFTCESSSTHCVDSSEVYCNFSVERVKEMMKSHDAEIELLTSRLASLEQQHSDATSRMAKLKARIQSELSRSTKRVYLMQPKLFAGHFVSTDNAILFVAVCASVGVAAGVLGGSVLFKTP